MNDRVLMIVNRAAGLGLRARTPEQPPAWWKDCPWGVRAPSSPQEMRSLCDSIDPDEYDGVFFAGGDGTFHQALPSLVRKKGLRLGVLPGGTANDLAQELGTSLNWDLVRKLVHRGTQPMDVIRVNDSYVATTAGTGVGAFLCQEVNTRRAISPAFRQLSGVLGDHIYSVLTAKTILGRSDYVHEVEIRSEEYSGQVKCSAIFVCNQARLGRHLSVAPDAVNHDGRFDVLVVTQTSKAALLKALLAIRAGRMPEGAIRFATDRMSIKELNGTPIPLFGDGEVLPSSDRVDISIVPGALSVYRSTPVSLSVC